MSCTNCCLYLCIVPVCDGAATLVIPNTTAQVSGKHFIVLEYLKTAKVYSKTFEIGEPLVFELDNLNENYAYVGGYILDSENKIVPIYTEGSAYTCFDFTTIPIYNEIVDEPAQ